MAKIVCIHGIAQQLEGSELLASKWGPALQSGMSNAGVRPEDIPPLSDITVAFYGNLFRGRKKSMGGDAPLELSDIDEGLESDLLMTWADAAAPPSDSGAPSKSGRAPRAVQAAAVRLLRVPFFDQLADRFLVGALKQVKWYLTEPETREAARERLSSLITPDTRVVIAHSLGSVVAYEVLCRSTAPIAPALITLGSPLGLPNLVFDRLDPAPTDGRGAWPGSAKSWTNIYADNDIVASVKRLAPLFTGSIVDVRVDNEASAHDVTPYLTAEQTGKAVLGALSGA
jgi:hypothetical protein